MDESLVTIEVILAICANEDKTAVVVKATVQDEQFSHLAQFNNIFAKENFFTQMPKEPGIYRCQVRYIYLPPDEWEYQIIESVRIV